MSNDFEQIRDDSPERDPDCNFCQELLRQEDGLVANTPFWRILVSPDQGYLGRCMVIAQRHIGDRAEMSYPERDDLGDAQDRLEYAVAVAFGAKQCDWTQPGNDVYQNDPQKPHLHHHLRPRYETLVEFAGYSFPDAYFGSTYSQFQSWNIDDEEAGDLKNRIADAIWENLPTHYLYYRGEWMFY